MDSSYEPLPLTKTHGIPGEAVPKMVATIGLRPHCSAHGAMLRVSPDRYWYRCSVCNIGIEDLTDREAIPVLGSLVYWLITPHAHEPTGQYDHAGPPYCAKCGIELDVFAHPIKSITEDV